MFLLYGLTDDCFILPDTKRVDLHKYLELNLRAAGFRRLAFHNPVDGVQITDINPSQQQHAVDASPVATLVDGPLGQMTVIPDRPRVGSSGATNDTQSRRSYSTFYDTDLPATVRSFFTQEEQAVRRAFIFEDLQHFLLVDHRASAPFWAVLRDVVRSRVPGNIIIFVSNSRTISDVRYSDDRPFLHSFRSEFFVQDSLRRNVVCIGPPDAGEIRSAQRRYRLRNRLPTNFSSLGTNCERIASELRAKTDLGESGLRYNDQRLREYDWTTREDTAPALDRLAALPGREEVAKRVRDDISYCLRQWEAKGMDHRALLPFEVERLSDHSGGRQPPPVDLSYAITGNPGTGKSTIARLMAKAMQEAGILRTGHCIEADVQDLVAGHVGGTALKASDLLNRALGGVLFLDEVQKLEKNNEFHREAVGTMLKYVEDHRGDISVIVATYPQRMEKFLEIDEGLPRRFSQRIVLDDYDASNCRMIFEHIADDRGITVSSELSEILEDFFEAWIHDRQAAEQFSNAGSVRNLLEAMDRIRHASSESDQRELSIEHIPSDNEAYKDAAVKRARLSPEERLRNAVKRLDELPGLAAVKETIKRVRVRIQAQLIRGEQNNIVPGHYSFEGSPGTGKTTVARHLGEILRELGVLRSGHLVSVTRSNLVGMYVGHTAPQVEKVAREALDGVLFIDEAHNLIQGDRDDFGREAITALTTILENHRHNLCVIVAGYGEPMQRLFDVDEGWAGRFSERLQFEDYTPLEMAKIFRLMCKERRRTIHNDLDCDLERILDRLRGSNDFANGRSVRRLVNEMESNLDQRLVDAPGLAAPNELTLSDVPQWLEG